MWRDELEDRAQSRPLVRSTAACAGILAIVATTAAGSWAAVAVVDNRADQPLTVTATVDGRTIQLALPAGEARSLFAETGVSLQIGSPQRPRRLALQPRCAYFVNLGEDGAIVAGRVPLGDEGAASWSAGPGAGLDLGGVIPVKIVVDDDEYRPPAGWERDIRLRVERASEILYAHAGVRLRVAGTGTWDSDDAQDDFFRSLDEFEREVQSSPGHVAIGFSSQYEIQSGRVHMGGTRGPLHPHILIRERARHIHEAERLALLVHELGHYLGATHSPQRTSVMRPVLGPGEQRAAGAPLLFDAPNTLLMSLVGSEIRRRGVREYRDLSAPTLRRMGQIYAALEPALPRDPASGALRRMTAAANVESIVADARWVLGEIVRVAKLRSKLAAREPAGTANATGDELTELYVRQAALAAKRIRQDTAAPALLIALATAVDDPVQMAKIPLAASLLERLETAQQQAERAAAIGAPTMRGRVDLTRHFFVTAELTVLAGPQMARASGLAKEISDSRGGSGFSFCDLAADEAGVRFAEAVLSGRLSLDAIAQRFRVEDFLPSVAELREGLTADDFAREFGSTGDPRFEAAVAQIRVRVAALPGYADPGAPAVQPQAKP